MATVSHQIRDQIKEQRVQIKERQAQIKYLRKLLDIEITKLSLLEELQEDIKEVQNDKPVLSPKLQKWNKMSIEKRLNSALPYDREDEQSELYDDDSVTKSNPLSIAELDDQLREYFKNDTRLEEGNQN
jgi:hypothetical protein